MSALIKTAAAAAKNPALRTSLGAALKRVGGSQAVRSALATALQSRGIRPGTPGSIRRMVGAGPRGRRGRRGITATELRGFRKVASLLNRYFQKAPAAMKRRGFKAKR